MVFVTGATGILGRVIILELLKRGKRVRAAKRKSSNLLEVKQSFRFYSQNPEADFQKIEWIETDLHDTESLTNIVSGIEEVYHCAAKISFHPERKKEMYHTNVEGTKSLLYACETAQVKKFCFVSSIAVLDNLNENGKIDENSNFNPKLDHSNYAISKHLSEMEVWRASAEGMNIVIINPGVIIGSGNWKQSSGTLFQSYEKFPFSFPGNTGYVDVRDVAYISTELMERNIFQEKFVLVSENKTFIEIAKIIREKLGLSPPKLIPLWLLKLVPIISWIFGWIFPILKIGNKKNIETITSQNKFSNKKIINKINYSFIPISESIDFHLKNYLRDKN